MIKMQKPKKQYHRRNPQTKEMRTKDPENALIQAIQILKILRMKWKRNQFLNDF